MRPLTMEDGGVVLMDLLWSDPTTNDGVEGVQPSPRGPGLVTFGPDRVKDFCKVPSPVNAVVCLGVRGRVSICLWQAMAVAVRSGLLAEGFGSVVLLCRSTTCR